MKLVIKYIVALVGLLSATSILWAQDASKSIAADFSVSPSGALTYQVPFEVPSYVLGHFPNLGLSFNSQAGDGIAGYGWSITGLSSITRTSATTYHDGFIDGVDFDADDRFTLDGQRLILKSGTYGKAGATYQTESYSNLKIESVGTSRYGAKYGPQYFVVYHPNGLRYWYGRNGTDSSYSSHSKLEWSVARIQDTQGNRVEFNYSIIDQTVRLNYVEDPVAKVRVQFFYTTKTNVNPIGIGGEFFTNKRLLNKVKVQTNTTNQYFEYAITHENVSDGTKRIKQIVQENRDNETLPPLKFNYFEDETTQVTEKIIKADLTSGSLGHISRSSVQAGDFNGDEVIDFLAYNIDRDADGVSKGINFYLSNPRKKDEYFASTLVNEEFEAVFSGRIPNRAKELENKNTFIVAQKSKDRHEINFTAFSVEDIGFKNFVNATSFRPPVDYGDKSGGHVTISTRINDATRNKKYTHGRITAHNQISGPRTLKEYEAKEEIIFSPGFHVHSNTKFKAGINENLDIGEYVKMNYLSGDFNGDGVTDIVALTNPYNDGKANCRSRGGKGVNGFFCEKNIEKAKVFLIDFNRMKGSNSESIGQLELGITNNSRLFVTDYDGDGLQEICHIVKKDIRIYGVNNGGRLYLKDYHQMSREPLAIFPGDYNGDGKTDFLTATENNKDTWDFYISNGGGIRSDTVYFTKYTRSLGFWYEQNRGGHYTYRGSGKILENLFDYRFIPVDYNKDGKTDLIKHHIITPLKSEFKRHSRQGIEYSTNISTSSDFLKFESKLEASIWNVGRPHLGHSAFASVNNKNLMGQYVFAEENGTVRFYDYQSNLRAQKCITSVENNGLFTEFEYHGLTSERDQAPGFSFASTYDDYVFNNANGFLALPYYKLDNLSGFKVVEKVKQSFSGLSREKEYRYSGLVGTNNGLGILGFTGLARSDWYGDGINAIWSMSTFDFNKRQAMTLQYSMADSPFGLPIEQTTYEYQELSLSNKVYGYFPKISKNENFLNGIISSNTNTYDSYYNVLTSKETYTGGSKTTTNTYFNNPSGTGVNYYIGRPKTKNTTTTLGSDSFSTGEAYSYANNFIKELKTKGNGTSWLTETYEHDGFGNITSKTISGVGIEDRTEKSKYDSTGRFMESATDIEGLTVSYAYDKNLGHLVEETDPFGKKQEFAYDGWNRLTKQTDFLGNTIETFYTGGPRTGDIRVSTASSLGTKSISYSNRLGWEYENGVTNALGEYVSTKVEYDAVGKIKRESQPYFSAPSQWTTHSYDQYNRPIRQQMYTGQIITTKYGIKTTKVSVDDGTKTVSATSDALGNTISMTDPGGTINYTYYANNTPKETNYGSHKITTKIDGWGRKIELNDPAAGVYSYKYNILGEILEERHANGTTTYEYDKYGKPTKKLIVGKETDMEIDYKYDATHKQLTSLIGFDKTTFNRYTYNYSYDTEQRPIKITEDQNKASFEKLIKYGPQGRVDYETYKSTNKLQRVQSNTISVKNQYHSVSGALEKISDKDSNKVLWQIKKQNQRGQLTEISIGNGITKTNKYDAYGLPQEFKAKKGANTVFDLSFDFDVKRGNLKSRHNKAFTGEEVFAYDDQDRLLSTKIDGAVVHSQSYEANGNIKNNSLVGTYNYQTQTRYRLAGIDLNAKGKDYYKTHTPQQIKYNANKKPVSIYEKDQGRVDFEYGPLMNRTVAYYGGLEEDKNKRDYVKIYSSIAPLEIVYDKTATNSTTKYISYVLGDAYTAPIAHVSVKESVFAPSPEVSNEYMYLHRDHLGSIMAITDSAANVKEETHYGAWGTIEQFKGANNATTLDESSILGRGYTGHEHFASVGLIHMNGRMYDAKLGRFLSPDNFIQDPFNTQSFNRYGYVWNNPLKFNDPSGEFVITLSAIIGSAIFKAAAIGAGVSVAVNGINNLANGQGFFDGAGAAALSGAISGVISFGIGSATAGISNLVAKGVAQGLLHGYSGAFMAAVQGGDPLAGFLGSAIGSGVSSLAGGVFGESTAFWNVAGTIAAAGVGGGIASEIAGGSFADGFRNGVIAAGLNHIAHRFIGPPANRSFSEKLLSDKISNLNKEFSNYGTAGDISVISGSLALDYRQSLSISQRVGMNGNLSFIRQARGISRIAGPLGNAAAVINIVQSSSNYQSGAISGAHYAWNIGSSVIPVVVGAEFGAVPGALAGVAFTAGQIIYNQVNAFFDFIYSNISWPNLGSAGIVSRGFGMVR